MTGSGDSGGAKGAFLNLDDLQETFKSIFGGEMPQVRSREGPGKEGRPIELVVNMFDISLPKNPVFHYDVEIYSVKSYASETSDVPVEKKSRCAATLVNRRVIEEFGKLYTKELGGNMPAFDGQANLYTKSELPFNVSRFSHLFFNISSCVQSK